VNHNRTKALTKSVKKEKKEGFGTKLSCLSKEKYCQILENRKCQAKTQSALKIVQFVPSNFRLEKRKPQLVTA
jgi:hypothetical protein